MIPENHNFTIERRTEKAFIGSPVRWRAECACGWVSPEWRRYRPAADTDGYLHQAVAKAAGNEAA